MQADKQVGSIVARHIRPGHQIVMAAGREMRIPRAGEHHRRSHSLQLVPERQSVLQSHALFRHVAGNGAHMTAPMTRIDDDALAGQRLTARRMLERKPEVPLLIPADRIAIKSARFLEIQTQKSLIPVLLPFRPAEQRAAGHIRGTGTLTACRKRQCPHIGR